MNPVILNMLSAYPMKTPDDQKKALLEVLQEIILNGLFQATHIPQGNVPYRPVYAIER